MSVVSTTTEAVGTTPPVSTEPVTPPAGDSIAPPEKPLLAGKYNSVDDLVKAYGEAQKGLTEKSQKLKEYATPDAYTLPEDVEIEGTQKEQLIAWAKDAGLTQSQFNKTLNKMLDSQQAARERAEQNQKLVKETLGDEKIQRLDAYIDKKYPAKLATALKDSYRNDKDIAEELYKDRETTLNILLPVGSSASGAAGMPEKRQQLRDLARKMADNPNDQKVRQQFEELARAGIAK